MIKSIMIILFSIFLTACGSKEPLTEDVSAEITMQGVEADINEDVDIGTLLSRTILLNDVMVPITDVTITLTGAGSEDFNVTLEAGTTANSYIGKVALLNSLDGKGGTTYELNATATANGQSVGPVAVKVHIINIPDEAIVSMCDETHGFEPWITDGTVEGTRLLKDVKEDGGSTFYSAPAKMGDKFYMSLDGILWESNGTTEGTILLKDINTSDDERIENLLSIEDTLYFSVYEDQLYKSDGTEENTLLIKDINTSEIGSFAMYQNKLYFFAIDREDGAASLWESNGTVDGTKLVKTIPDISGTPKGLTFIGDTLYFAISSEGSMSSSLEIWKSTGTPSSEMFFEVDNSIANSALRWMGKRNNQLHFLIISFGEITIHSLWKKDADDYSKLRDIDFELGHIQIFKDLFLFLAMQGEGIMELWLSDGSDSEEGSKILKSSLCAG